MLQTDPRPAVQKVMSRKMEFDYEGGTVPEWVWDKLAI